MGLTSYGFSTSDISNYLGTSYQDTEAVQRVFAGSKDPNDLAVAQKLHNTPVYDPIFGTANKWDNVIAGFEHLSQHPLGSHYHGDFGKIISDIGRAFAGLFTLGLTEIPVGDKRLGEVSRIEPVVSGELSGGNFVTGSMNPTEKKDFELGFKSGTALAGVSAATAGTSYSLSGNLGDIAAAPSAGPAVIDPTYFGFEEGTMQSLGITPYGEEQALTPAVSDSLAGAAPWQGQSIQGGSLQHTAEGNLLTQAQALIVKGTGKIGAAITALVTGNIGGAISTIFGGPGGSPPANTVYRDNPIPMWGGGGGGGSGFNPGTVKEGSSTGALVFFGVLAGAVLLVLYFRKRG